MRFRPTDYVVAFLLILCLNFALPRLMPGDPMSAIYGQEALLQMAPEVRSELAARLGLNQPVHVQFARYIGGLAKGELGYSFYHKAKVSRVLAARLPWTLLLVGSALVLSTVGGVLLGIESAWRRGGKLDRALLVGMMSVSGFPSFFIGVVFLLIFAAGLGWFPLQGAKTAYAGFSGISLVTDVFEHLVLPMATLMVVFTPGMYFLSRQSMLGTLGEPYILTATAKGLSDRSVRYGHAARNSLLPVVTASGIMLARRVVTGALFVEVVFSYPGMGTLIRQSLATRDYPVLQGALLVTALLVLATNLAIDLFYRTLDPRIGRAR